MTPDVIAEGILLTIVRICEFWLLGLLVLSIPAFIIWRWAGSDDRAKRKLAKLRREVIGYESDYRS
jgi:hypothetical protein